MSCITLFASLLLKFHANVNSPCTHITNLISLADLLHIIYIIWPARKTKWVRGKFPWLPQGRRGIFTISYSPPCSLCIAFHPFPFHTASNLGYRSAMANFLPDEVLLSSGKKKENKFLISPDFTAGVFIILLISEDSPSQLNCYQWGYFRSWMEIHQKSNKSKLKKQWISWAS